LSQQLVAGTEASMRFPAILHRGGCATASSSQPVPSTDSNCNCNDITNITNMTSVENPGLVDERAIEEGVMWLRGVE